MLVKLDVLYIVGIATVDGVKEFSYDTRQTVIADEFEAALHVATISHRSAIKCWLVKHNSQYIAVKLDGSHKRLDRKSFTVKYVGKPKSSHEYIYDDRTRKAWRKS